MYSLSEEMLMSIVDELKVGSVYRLYSSLSVVCENMLSGDAAMAVITGTRRSSSSSMLYGADLRYARKRNRTMRRSAEAACPVTDLSNRQLVNNLIPCPIGQGLV